MQQILRTSVFLCLLLIITGCYRDELCFQHPQHAVIDMTIDWSRSAFDANSATAILYKDGAYYSTEIVSVYPPVYKRLDLPVGRYDIVVHNDQASDFQTSLSFRGLDLLSTYEVSTLQDNIRQDITRSYRLPVDSLSVDRILDFEVTPEMLAQAHKHPVSKDNAEQENTVLHTIHFTPRRVFTEVIVTLNVHYGSGYSFSRGNPPSLTGMAGSYFAGTDRYAADVVTHALTLAPALRRGDNKTVVFTGTQLCVGIPGRQGTAEPELTGDYSLRLPFVHKEGVELREVDLKQAGSLITYTTENPTDPTRNWDVMRVTVDLELPELVNVGDWEVDVDDWVDVDIPLDGPQKLYFLANNGTNDSFSMINRPGVVINMPLPVLIPALPGDLFVEWNRSPDGSGTSYKAGDIYEMERGTKIFYAIWKRQ